MADADMLARGRFRRPPLPRPLYRRHVVLLLYRGSTAGELMQWDIIDVRKCRHD
jgi:hypothetical protein